MDVTYSDTMTVLSFFSIFLIVVMILSLAGMVVLDHITAIRKTWELERHERRRKRGNE